MGRDLTILSKHDIDFDKQDVLLERLATIHQANVILGFVSYINLSEHFEVLDFENIDKDYVGGYKIKSLNLDTSLPTIFVLIDNYLYKWLRDQYGDKAGALPAFKSEWFQEESKNNDIIQRFIEEDDDFYEVILSNSTYHIYRNHLDLSGLYSKHRWWGFFYCVLQQKVFSKEDHFVLKKDLLPIKQIARSFGGRELWFLDDQSNMLKGIGQGEEYGMTWNNILTEIKLRAGEDKIIDLSKCITDHTYLQQLNKEIGDRVKEYSVFFDGSIS